MTQKPSYNDAITITGGELDIHKECKNLCRSCILTQYIEQHPECLAKRDEEWSLPLHRLLENQRSASEDALMMIAKYPAALQHDNFAGRLPIHIECSYQCRPIIISKCIELYPEALSKAELHGYLPLHRLLSNTSSSIHDALLMIEKYPAALIHWNIYESVPIFTECRNRCRSIIISKCVELYPETLAKADRQQYLPLHVLLDNDLSTIADALMMIEKYPGALRHWTRLDDRPIYIECAGRCRSAILQKCIDLFPESLADNRAISIVVNNASRGNPETYLSTLAMFVAARPLSLYDISETADDIRDYPHYRRRILNLLPCHVFTPVHEEDYRDLNWQPRAAMMMLLSQIQVQQQQQKGSSSHGHMSSAADMNR
jgi:hypothetical protein